MGKNSLAKVIVDCFEEALVKERNELRLCVDVCMRFTRLHVHVQTDAFGEAECIVEEMSTCEQIHCWDGIRHLF